MGHEFELRKEIEVEATPEQVWEAITTGPGIDSWFMGRNQVDERLGGSVRMTIGDETMESTITAWEPPNRFAHRGESPDGAFFMAFEWLVEGREGASSLVRLVQSGILGDDWETEYNALNEGDSMYIHKLAQYLKYFRGRVGTPVAAMLPQPPDRERTWARLIAGLGLDGKASEGDQVRFTPEGLPPVDGVVDYVSPSFLGVRTSDALYRFIYGYDGTVVIGHHIFADVDREQTERAWQAWLTRVFA